ncbi:MAG: ABC transporter permease, partial [Hyphomicrobiales bacterium]
ALETLMGYLAGSIVRGVMVACTITFLIWLTVGLLPAHPLVVLIFVVLGSAFLGGLGIIAAIFANKFDQMAAITNFIITPLSFLSGTFYSIESLPWAVQLITRFNPVFYLIDGARYGFIGSSDASPVFGIFLCFVVTSAVLAVCWSWLRTGYRMKP